VFVHGGEAMDISGPAGLPKSKTRSAGAG